MGQQTPGQQGPSTSLSTLGLALVGAVLGAMVGGARLGGAVIWLGAGLGAVFGLLRVERARSEALTQSVQALARRIEQLEGSAPDTGAAGATSPVRGTEAGPVGARTDGGPTTPPPAESGAVPPRPSPPPAASARPPAPAPARPVPAPPSPPSAPSHFDRFFAGLRALVFGGNTVVRGGVLVLLVGVTLLARWAAEHSLFPIEARLASASLIGLALVGVGFRLRSVRPGFGTTLQGGGLAALYLVSFIAFRLYDLVPVGLAFGLFVVIAAASGTLAVLQRALPLIVIASLGGFLAPILASTGSGNHVALFGYYLVLNVSIAAIAFVRSWRVLNVLAFVCTYGVATAWGVLSYKPHQLASTLPFVFAFMMVFTGEALLFAWRQPPRLKGLVDGTLVFGTPLVSLLALARLLQDVEMGLAMATSGMALFYAAIAVWLWRTAPETLRQLSEAFVALAIGLATMAVPFAFEDSPTTAIVWALEGAGIHWVGARQSRTFPRCVGLALQPLAAVAFMLWHDGARDIAGPWLANGRFLSALALAFAGLAIAREADMRRDERGRLLWAVAQAAGVWGLGWWSFGVVSEAEQFVAHDFQIAVVVAMVGVSGVALRWGAWAARWESGQLMSLLALPAAALVFVDAADHAPSLLSGGGVFAWPFCLGAIHFCVVWNEASPWRWARRAHAPWLWLCSAVAGTALFGLADHDLSLGHDWGIAGMGFGLGGVAVVAMHAIQRGWGAFGRFVRLHFTWGVGPILAIGLLWAFGSNFAGSGETWPLPYLPLANPVDLGVCLVGLATLVWAHRFPAIESTSVLAEHRPQLLGVAAALAFAWLNAVLARSVSQWSDVPYRADALWDSTALQVCLSITWTLVGFVGMWSSTRRRLRKAWMAFAALLALTVVKLFVVDLSQLTTPAKIATFLVVGVLLLVVGYLSPVPPDAAPDAESGGTGDRDGSATVVDGTGERTRPAVDASSLIVWLAAGLMVAGSVGPAPAAAASDDPLEMNDFAWRRAIVSRSDVPLQVVDLPYEVYRDTAEPGLADVRVFDADGRAVPHAITRPKPPATAEARLTPLPLYRLPEGKNAREVFAPDAGYRIDVGLDGGRATLQVEPSAPGEAGAPGTRAYLVDASDLKGPITGLEFELAPSTDDFLVPLRVEASEDFVHYDTLSARAVIARLTGPNNEPIEQKRIPLRRFEPRYLRITWPAEGEAPDIVGVSAVQGEGAGRVPRSSTRIRTVSAEEGGFVADLGGWLPVDRIRVDLGPGRALVSARVYEAGQSEGPWRLVHRGLVYQLGQLGQLEPGLEAGAFDDAEAEAGRTPAIELAPRPTRFIKLEIDARGGGAARPAPTLEVGWPVEQLYFIDQGRAPHALVYGKAGAPADRFTGQDLLALDRRRRDDRPPLPATATLGPREELRGRAAMEPRREVPYRTLVLWAVLLASVAIVATLALRLLREMREADRQ